MERGDGVVHVAGEIKILGNGAIDEVLFAIAEALVVGFATAPFYTFTTPFLIRTHGFTTAQVGLSFGLLQGLTGVIGALVGGRMFDRAVRGRSRRLLLAPALMLGVGAVSTVGALFAPEGWMAIGLFVPAMLGFAFLLPWLFGAAHRVAGAGREAMASSLGLVASGLFGPAVVPVLVGMISDGATAASIPNGLGLGLLIGPVCSVLTALTLLAASGRIAAQKR